MWKMRLLCIMVWDRELNFHLITCLETSKIHVFQPQTWWAKTFAMVGQCDKFVLEVANQVEPPLHHWARQRTWGNTDQPELKVMLKPPTSLQINVFDCLPTRWSGTRPSHWFLRTALPISTAREDIFNVEVPVQGRPTQLVILVAGGNAFEHNLIFVLYLENEVECIFGPIHAVCMLKEGHECGTHSQSVWMSNYSVRFLQIISLSLYP